MSTPQALRLMPWGMLARPRNSPWVDSLILPVYAIACSGVILLLQSLTSAFSKHDPSPSEGESQTHSRRPCFQQTLKDLGGGTIFAYKLTQLLLIFCLLEIYTKQLILEHREAVPYIVQGSIQVIQTSQCAFYARLHFRTPNYIS